MKAKILHEYGLNEQGKLIKAKDALKCEKYFCAGCKTKFILRKSSKTGIGSRIPHFAHNNLKGSCSYESYIHKTFIILATKLLNYKILNNQPIIFQWACNTCKQQHSMNLLGFSEAKSEFNMKERKPDIALLDKTGNAFMVIEIVYKHPPEYGALQFYRNHNIHVIQVIISSDKDLNNVEQKIMKPSSFDLCIAPRIRPIQPLRPYIPRYNNYYQIPMNFLDNPQKYRQAKNDSFSLRKNYSRKRKSNYKKSTRR